MSATSAGASPTESGSPEPNMQEPVQRKCDTPARLDAVHCHELRKQWLGHGLLTTGRVYRPTVATTSALTSISPTPCR
jgi:hypothetical protein